ncbi:acid-shock protein, partial [Mesorhizobium sp. M7A.F.Ca.CA.001.09.2.1]
MISRSILVVALSLQTVAALA